MGKVTRRVIVSYSGGKDSAVTLDLCSRYFENVYVFRMYYVPGLSFHRSMARWIDDRYGLNIFDVPHFMTSSFLRYGTFRLPDLDVPIVTIKEIYDYVREYFGAWWIAGGERIKDSIWRNAMLKRSGSIDDMRGRFFPVAYWSKSEIERYIRRKKIKISPESHILGYSFRSLMPKELESLKTYYPEDYRKIQSWFPMVEASRVQGRMMGMNENKVSEI